MFNCLCQKCENDESFGSCARHTVKIVDCLYKKAQAENAKLKARVEAAEYFIAVLTTYGDFSVPKELISEPRSAWEALI